ncbi:MAG: peptidase M64 [Bacteroidales bacterium]|nr:peptidase M64 [Bacteroidales bacterium]
MRKIFLFVFIILAGFASAQFHEFFENKTLRIDYYHAGDSQTDAYFLDEVRVEPFWGGSYLNLIETFEYGHYFFKVFDQESGKLIYSRGYSTLFGEWQTTGEAKQTTKSFSETVVLPYPHKDARIVFYSRDDKGLFIERFVYLFKPGNYFISPERHHEYPAFDVHISGDPSKNVDIVFLPDGYTNDEMGLFIKDCQQFAEHLFQFSPFKENSDNFNIRGILAPSEDQGNDIPADSVWKRSIVSTSFYTFDSERYCMTRDNKTVRDLAANVPYDQIYILVNQAKYGGGGIYNHYCVSVNSNEKAAKIFVHEFGHGFAGLGDEYYTSSVAYSDFYPLNIEPWEPNITTMVDFDKKWKHLLAKKTPIPTPDTEEYFQTLGVFEGGGYAAKGVFRPAHDCLMNSFEGDEFCGACKEAIQKMIDFYSE